MATAKRKLTTRSKKLRFQDLIATGPGTLAGDYLRRFWQPIQRAEELRAGAAKPIEIMSEQFTLYRGATGAPHVASKPGGVRATHLAVMPGSSSR